MENKNKLILFIIILIIAFVVITYLKNLNVKEKTIVDTQQITTPKLLTCEESCNDNQECIKGCYIIKLNQAVVSKNIKLCEEIPDQEYKQTCKDNVNFNLAQLNKDILKCDLILNNDAKETCKGLLK